MLYRLLEDSSRGTFIWEWGGQYTGRQLVAEVRGQNTVMDGTLKQLKDTLARHAYHTNTLVEIECWNALKEAIDQIEKLAGCVAHVNGCSRHEWSDEAQHIPTKWSFVIDADKCSCGAIKVISGLLT